jgi:hypothetical protein
VAAEAMRVAFAAADFGGGGASLQFVNSRPLCHARAGGAAGACFMCIRAEACARVCAPLVRRPAHNELVVLGAALLVLDALEGAVAAAGARAGAPPPTRTEILMCGASIALLRDARAAARTRAERAAVAAAATRVAALEGGAVEAAAARAGAAAALAGGAGGAQATAILASSATLTTT